MPKRLDELQGATLDKRKRPKYVPCDEATKEDLEKVSRARFRQWSHNRDKEEHIRSHSEVFIMADIYGRP